MLLLIAILCEGVIGNSCAQCEGTGWMDSTKRSQELKKKIDKLKSEISQFKRNIPPNPDQRF
jgi:hypothetical protein